MPARDADSDESMVSFKHRTLKAASTRLGNPKTVGVVKVTARDNHGCLKHAVNTSISVFVNGLYSYSNFACPNPAQDLNRRISLSESSQFNTVYPCLRTLQDCSLFLLPNAAGGINSRETQKKADLTRELLPGTFARTGWLHSIARTLSGFVLR